ncbi:MAG: hypothetical protein ABI647_04005 [Gemmatimonadota bacterium]
MAVEPGAQLRLSIMSAAFPLLARNLNTGGRLGSEATPIGAHQVVFHGAAGSSFVTLPIVEKVHEIETP